jgi:cytochrome c biogenesis protein CcdA
MATNSAILAAIDTLAATSDAVGVETLVADIIFTYGAKLPAVLVATTWKPASAAPGG